MAFPYFTNAVTSGMLQQPNEMYRDLQQEFINQQWDNTTAIINVQEQDDVGINHYHCLDVWITPTMQDTTRGMSDTNDFNKLIFRDISHKVKRGQMYIFDDNYWIVHSYNEYNGLAQDCGIRRCNNALRIVDPLNGAVKVFPCCVDYDMASPSPQINRYINTPNNHAVVMVQGNDETLRLLKTNTRYVLSGRVFKLLGYQNAVEFSIDLQKTTLLYLDMYLDEVHDRDDIENSIADNGIYDYSININLEHNSLALSPNATGKLTANVLLNGLEVERPIIWKSANEEVVEIDAEGNYQVVGDVGDATWVWAKMQGNHELADSIQIAVVSDSEQLYSIQLEPMFSKIREYEQIDFAIELHSNGQIITEFSVLSVELLNGAEEFASLQHLEDNVYKLTAIKITDTPILLRIIAQSAEMAEAVNVEFAIDIVSMLG